MTWFGLSFGKRESRSQERVNQALHNWSLGWEETEQAEVTPMIVEPFEAADEWSLQSLPMNQPARPDRCESELMDAPLEEAGPDPVEETLELDLKLPNSDYYEVLQISRAADPETVHRVYRMMASRFHPDNRETGNLDKFLSLREAHRVLSEPRLRAQYDRSLQARRGEALPAFGQKGFVDGLEGEMNRRLGVLSLLYNRRRLNEDRPGISVLDLERLMSFPREYLQFTLWYLRSKGFVTLEDNSDYAVTPAGVDYLEEQSAQNKLIQELLLGAAAPEIPGHTLWVLPSAGTAA